MPRSPAKRLAVACAAALALQGLAGSAPCAAASTAVRLTPAASLNERDDLQPESPPTYVRADRMEGDTENRLVLTGNAEIRRGGAVLRGDRITYTRRTDEVEATGNAQVFRNGARFVAPKLRFKIDAHVGEMEDMTFTYGPRKLRGGGKKAAFVDDHTLRVTDGKCTACAKGDDSWMLHAKNFEIDTEDQTAVGHWAWLELMDVPVLAAPWFTFPVGNARRSGILTPTMGVSSKLGVNVAVPYYWNIAPNYDYTAQPWLMTKRGLFLGNEFRYLQDNWHGQINYDVIPEDRNQNNETRYSVKWKHSWRNDSGFYWGANYSKVSDEDYLSDFSSNVIQSSESVLYQNFWAGYSQKYWNARVAVNKNQTLHLDGVAYDKPYERVPQITWRGRVADFYGLRLSMDVEATRYKHPTKIDGDRLLVQPSIAYPMRGSWWFATPKLTFLNIWNDMDSADPRVRRGAYDRTSEMHLPMWSFDTGLMFDREFQMFGKDTTQTLEPRLYYAYVPFREQSKMPAFESSLANLSPSLLFRENIYAGSSRVASNNSVTAAVTSRVIDDETGHEWMSATIGQRYYFEDPQITRHKTLAQKGHSDYVGALRFSPAKNLTAEAALRYSLIRGKLSYGTAGFRYRPSDVHKAVFGLYYRYNYVNDNIDNDDNIKQVDVTVQWPLSSRLWFVGRYNYSYLTKTSIEQIAGLEYRADCWTFRTVLQSYRSSDRSRNSAFFFQLELDGLGGLGSNPLPALQSGIPGYQPLTPEITETGRYDYYE